MWVNGIAGRRKRSGPNKHYRNEPSSITSTMLVALGNSTSLEFRVRAKLAGCGAVVSIVVVIDWGNTVTDLEWTTLHQPDPNEWGRHDSGHKPSRKGNRAALQPEPGP